MKVLLFASILFLFSCGAENRNTEIANQLFEHFNNHDWQKMASMYDEMGEFKDPSFGLDPIKMSHDDIITKYKELHTIFPDIHDEVIAIYPSGKKHVIIEFVSTGTSVEGKTFQLPICTILTIEHGKITKDYNYYDNF